jgi:hypothetical protein
MGGKPSFAEAKVSSEVAPIPAFARPRLDRENRLEASDRLINASAARRCSVRARGDPSLIAMVDPRSVN